MVESILEKASFVEKNASFSRLGRQVYPSEESRNIIITSLFLLKPIAKNIPVR
jgi:hypothetical protein